MAQQGKVKKELLNNQGFTPKQAKFIKEYVNTLNATEAAMRAYDAKDRTVARNIGSENLSKLGTPITQLLNEAGLTREALIQDIMEGRQAEKIAITNGKVYKAPDWSNRYKYTELGAKLHKMFPDTKIDIEKGDKGITIRIVEDTTLKDANSEDEDIIEGEMADEEEISSII